VSTRMAEMIKYACNAFHAVKVSFANEIGSLCEELDISGAEVMATLCRDGKLNVSAAYLRPGFSFGGSCLPKDLRALMYRSRTAGLELPLLGHVLESNERHLKRLVERVMALPGKRIGIYGLAFKENTDDLRESPVVQLIEALSGKGRELRVFDPQIDLTKIYGSNQQYLFRVIPHIGNLMRPNLDDVTSWADEIVIAQRPSEAMSAALAACGKPVLNLAG
jgi:GDP-mannose 6-dehydrogenase